MNTLRFRTICLCIFASVAPFCSAAPVHTTYVWHLEQPVYWPAPSEWTQGYQTAWESIQHRNGGAAHPENNVAEIFSVADRVAAYQYRLRDAIGTMSGTDAGAQVTYTGGLVRNVASLGAQNAYGYSASWNSANIQARGWTTSGGRPRLEMVIIPYHHALAPLVDKTVLKKEIQIYQYLYPWVWGSTPAPSVGFFPPELAFSERIIPALAECGITWCLVPSNHISRACSNFPLVLGTGGENCDPPNPADQINPSSAHWFSLTISRGCTPTDAVPYSFQPHYAQHVNPQTGVASQVVVVPVAMAMSWQDGYMTYGVGDINNIAAYNDPNNPMIAVLGHDGDNAWGGGYSYYMESVAGFTSQAVAAGYEPTTVPEFLADHPVSSGNIAHVEDGAWVNADGDFGSPDFINWNWPPYNSSGQFDIPNGWALDIRNWAVITAATNRVVTAEAVAGGISLAGIQDPSVNPATLADLAWHFLLGSLNSGFMYYGNSLDMEMKPTVACNEAVDYADQVLAGGGDPTPPTIWTVQQHPHNPGGIGFGSLWSYQQTPQPRAFYIWTFIHDVSGVSSATVYYRLDTDGVNPLASTQNETFAGGSEVTSWRARTLTRRAFPAGNIYNDPEISFGDLPTYIADQYYYHLTDAEVADSGGVLVDYYIEAVDSLGNVARSDIYHTYVGTGTGGSTGDRVHWSPQNPVASETVTIYYDATQGPLPAGTNPVYIHIGHSGWQGIISPDPQMTYDSGEEEWFYAYSIPSAATTVDFVFRDNSNNWDNNGGSDWHVTVTGGGSSGFLMDGSRDASAQTVAAGASITLWAGWNGSDLYLATESAQGTGQDRFLFVSNPPGTLSAAPWAKAGQVANWAAFLAQEENNGWRGWFDASGATASAAGTVLEGTINLAGELGSIPPAIYLCAARYATADGGTLQGQAPSAVIGNGNIEAAEWVRVPLKPDSLTIYPLTDSVQLRWTTALGAVEYIIYRATDVTGTLAEIGRATSAN
ncbi:hypothetical protein EHM69_00260, partial [candidate division KSB1 bacterium]